MSSFSGTFNADGQVSNYIVLSPGQSISYSFTTSSLTGSVVVEKAKSIGAGFTQIIATLTDTGSGTYRNESQSDEYVRVRCVELDDDPGSETVDYTLADQDYDEYDHSNDFINPITGDKEAVYTDKGLEFKRETVFNNIAASKALALDANKSLVASTPLTALHGVTPAANKLPYFDGAASAAVADFTAFARTLLDDADAATARATLGVPSIVDAADAQASVLDQVDFTSAEPGSPTSGDRYINTATGSSSGTAQSVTANYIYEWNGSTWDETIPNEGAITTDEDANLTLLFNGSAWINLAGYTVHNSLTGLQGGTSNEYYHLTSAEYTDFQAMNTAGLEALTSGEVDQLENIGATTISASQWGYLGNLDQALTTASAVQHASLGVGVAYSATAVIVAQTGSTTDAVLRLVDAGVAEYNFTFPDANGLTFGTSTGSTKTFKLDNAGAGQFDFDVVDGVIKVAGTQVITSQQSAIASLTDSSGGSDDGTIAAVTDQSETTDNSVINDNFSELHTKLEAILTALRAHGLIAT